MSAPVVANRGGILPLPHESYDTIKFAKSDQKYLIIPPLFSRIEDIQRQLSIDDEKIISLESRMSGIPRSKISEIITNIKLSNSKSNSRHSYSVSSISDIDAPISLCSPTNYPVLKLDFGHQAQSSTKENIHSQLREVSSISPHAYPVKSCSSSSPNTKQLSEMLIKAEENKHSLASSINNLKQKIKESESTAEVL